MDSNLDYNFLTKNILSLDPVKFREKPRTERYKTTTVNTPLIRHSSLALQMIKQKAFGESVRYETYNAN